MKAKTVFITIHHDNIPGKSDYPQNIPLPRIGETVIYESSQGKKIGKVYDVRHVITETVADISILVRDK